MVEDTKNWDEEKWEKVIENATEIATDTHNTLVEELENDYKHGYDVEKDERCGGFGSCKALFSSNIPLSKALDTYDFSAILRFNKETKRSLTLHFWKDNLQKTPERHCIVPQKKATESFIKSLKEQGVNRKFDIQCRKY
jgi:hypothetical protein